MKYLAIAFGWLAASVPAYAQSASVRGVVRENHGTAPVSGAEVSGSFEFTNLAPGAYTLRVRKLGFEQAHESFVLVVSDSLRRDIAVSIADLQKALAERQQREFQAALKKARSRPRRWTCESRPTEVLRQAKEWLWLAEAAPNNENHWAVPTDSARFLRDFRAVTSQAECERIAAAVDSSYGLIRDHVSVFRVGRIHLLPELNAIADERGVVTSVFVSQ
jgi:hypothetical protein